MLKTFIKWIRNKGSRKKRVDGTNAEIDVGELANLKLSRDMHKNINSIKKAMNENFDIKSKEFRIGGQDIYGGLIYISNLVSGDLILEHIATPLMFSSSLVIDDDETILFNTVKESMVTAEYVKEAESLDDIVLAIMSGDTFLCIHGYDKGLIINTKEYTGRQVGEPLLEPTVKGTREGFVEILRTNIGLIRRRLRDPNLVFTIHKVGERTKLEVLIVYLKDIADEALIKEVNDRISSLDIDGVLGTAQLGQYITDDPNSIFPLNQITERPDRVVKGLMDGRVAILMEGSSDVLLVPVTLPLLLQSADDYYENWIISSTRRLSRYLGFFISSFLPALYIAVTSHHPDMLPTKLVLIISGARAGRPFTSLIEAVIMEITLELLQEASIRLPRVIGESVAIVGGIVIGQGAVEAGLVGPIMVIIISLTAIGSFVITDYSLGLATRIIRIPFMLLALTLGGFGIAMGMLALLIYVADLKSFGVSYIRPLSPYNTDGLKEDFIRVRERSLIRRPSFLNPVNKRRKGGRDEG